MYIGQGVSLEARYAAQTERRAVNTAMAQASASAATPAEWASSASPTFLSPTAEVVRSMLRLKSAPQIMMMITIAS